MFAKQLLLIIFSVFSVIHSTRKSPTRPASGADETNKRWEMIETPTGVLPRTRSTLVIPSTKPVGADDLPLPPDSEKSEMLHEGGAAGAAGADELPRIPDSSSLAPGAAAGAAAGRPAGYIDDSASESSDADDEAQPIPVDEGRPTRRPKKSGDRSGRLGNKSSSTGMGDAVGVGAVSTPVGASSSTVGVGSAGAPVGASSGPAGAPTWSAGAASGDAKVTSRTIASPAGSRVSKPKGYKN